MESGARHGMCQTYARAYHIMTVYIDAKGTPYGVVIKF